MRDRLAHRGPDGARSWIGELGPGSIALGHRRLSILDLSAAASQPMFSEDGLVAIAYNGEIYNFVELRAELAAHGARFRTQGDTEVLLAAYERWGVECVTRLNGMFAFAIWDGRTQDLFVARDRFGEKPLFYAQLPNSTIAFASEIKALLSHPQITAQVDEDTLADYVRSRYYEDGSETFFQGIRRLEPAHALLVGADGTIRRRWRYWSPDYTAIRDDYDATSGAAHFRELLARSIEMRLRSDVPVGTSLSGGLDSSMIVCLLAHLRNESVNVTQNTFSGRFDLDPSVSEGPEIDVVTGHTGVNAFGVTPDPTRLMAESELLHWYQEEPFLSASIYAQWSVMRLASEHHTTVLLDGQGADELLGGYQFYFRSHQLDLLDEGRLAAALSTTSAFNRRLRRARRGYPDSARRFNARVAYRTIDLLALWRRRPGAYASAPYPGVVAPAVPGMRLRRQMSEALLFNSLPMLLRYADRSAMAFSRETRFPFLDHDLVDWCISLPDRAFIDNGWQKLILRRAGEGLLPRSIQWRADKVGYAAPLDLWLRGPLKKWASERLFEGRVVDVPGYNRAELEQLWRAHQTGSSESSWALWRWISLNEWFSLLDGGAWKRGLPTSPSTTAAVLA